jgi:pantoate--beta-alanine ligase
MKILENKSKIDDFLSEIRKKGQKIGLIPTMGSIHDGHLSLIEECKKLGYFSLVTIFVNPTQFDETDDYDQYPRNKIQDIKFLDKINTDLLFFPSSEDLYPLGISSKKTILSYRNILCDKFRPGHFDGVTTVVNSLFNLINPDHVFFGEKDFQQLKLIEKLIENNNFPILIHPCISIRMSNGMSFSSRYNNFNSLQEKIFDNAASKIMISLSELKMKADVNIIEKLKEQLKEININKIDYLEIRDENNLLPSVENKNSRLFLAFYINNIRIVDNFILY